MNIGRQWEGRLRIWSEQFEKHYTHSPVPLSLTYFTTMARLSFGEAAAQVFSPAPVGMKWGQKWEYGWFRTRFTVPAALAGERLVLFLRPGEEMLVFVNGQERGAIDKQHAYIPLTRNARAGETFEILAECYAGHGVRNEGGGIIRVDEASVPEPPEAQCAVRESCVAVWNEAMFQAAMDYQTLYSLVKRLPEKSLRAMKVVEGLKQFTCIADFELPEPELTRSVVEARKVLTPLLACRNGSTAPEYSVFGQSHLDLAWLWPVEETLRKTARTYSNQLTLMEEYPEYRFLLCEPPILECLRVHYPNVFRRVKENADRFIPEGAMWVESDTNIPSGESLIRQFVWGKRWFRREMGVESLLAWMPDTFGFSAALPQILKGCQVPYFTTQKLLRQDPECEPFPYNLFYWEGLDGSRVLGHIYKKNNTNFRPDDLIARWEDDRIQQEGLDGLIYPFGYGDGGGGPTRQMLEIARRCEDLEGAPRCKMESPVRYFERQGEVKNVYRGELYLAWHRGTLTAQAETKRCLRAAETALRQAEALMAQCVIQGRPLQDSWKEKLEEAWSTLLFNQFHDIAAGAGIHRVHAEAVQALKSARNLAEQVIEAIASEPCASPARVLNLLSWPREFRGVTIPAQGSALLPRIPDSGASVTPTGDGFLLRNEHLSCRVNARGELTSVQDTAGHEYLAGPGNRLLMYKDVNIGYDAWEIGRMYEDVPVPLEGEVRLSVLDLPDGVGLCVERTLHLSPMRQVIFLGHHARRVEFRTHLDNWQERHKLLKVSFPVRVCVSEALHEIQFGYLKRPTHRSRVHDQDQYEVCNHRYTLLSDGALGAAVLNDSKYGVNVRDNDIRLTLLRAPMMPDMTADQGVQSFTYAFCPFSGPFQHSRVLQEAAELNEPTLYASEGFQMAPICVPECPNIVVETIKPADTISNALLVRAYEAMGMQTETAFTLHPSVRRVTETDMLEEHPQEADLTRPIPFRAFEIKTFLLHL